MPPGVRPARPGGMDKDGYASLPQGPGLGVEMDEALMAKVAADPKKKFKWPHPTYPRWLGAGLLIVPYSPLTAWRPLWEHNHEFADSSYFAAVFTGFRLSSSSAIAEVKILLPRNRTAYQTNEWIDLSVSRSADKASSATDLELRLIGTAAASSRSRYRRRIPSSICTSMAGCLRPGKYTVEASSDGATGRTEIEVCGPSAAVVSVW